MAAVERQRYFPSQELSGSLILLAIGLALGFVFGAGLIGRQKAEGAVQWALTTTADCEETYVGKGYSSVTECLEFAIWAAEDEIRAQKSEDGQDAGR